MGTASQLIVEVQVVRGAGSDAPWFAPLRAKARRSVGRTGRSARVWLLADAGFDGQDMKWIDVISPICRGGRLQAWLRVVRAEFADRVQESGLYGSALEGGDGDFGNQVQVWGWGSSSEVAVGASRGVGKGCGVQLAPLFCCCMRLVRAGL